MRSAILSSFWPLLLGGMLFILSSKDDVVAQPFGPTIRSESLVGFYNPGIGRQVKDGSLLARQFEGFIGTSFGEDNDQRAVLQHNLVGGRVRSKLGGRDAFYFSGLLENNALRPLRHTALQVNATYERPLLSRAQTSQLYLTGGFTLGLRNWFVRDAPNLIPFDQGDPILAVNSSLTPRPFLNLGVGLFFRSQLSGGRYRERPGEGEFIVLSGALALKAIGGCTRDDCFTFESGLPNGAFTLGTNPTTQRLLRMDVTGAYLNDKKRIRAASLRIYHDNNAGLSYTGAVVSASADVLGKGLFHLALGGELEVLTTYVRIGYTHQLRNKGGKSLQCSVYFSWFLYPVTTLQRSEFMGLASFSRLNNRD